jgi:mono/diheme cytochrome c family protein
LRAEEVSDSGAYMSDRSTMSLAILALLSAMVMATSCVATREDHGACLLRGDTTVSGHDEFMRACAPCHGADGRGGGPVAVALRTPPGDLTVLAARAGGRFPREHVIGVLNGEVRLSAHGSREMPVWSERFAPSDFGATVAASLYTRRWIEALVTYVESMQRTAAADRPPQG